MSVSTRAQRQMLSTSGVRVSVCEDPGPCPLCAGPMHVQKTVNHHGKTLHHGPFDIRETVHVCAAGCRYANDALVTRRAVSLARHIIAGRSVGYDVMVFVGIQRFLHHRQREEIRNEILRSHGIALSAGEISDLAIVFLRYMRALHLKHSDRLRAVLEQDGGWPLHVDATCEDGRGTLLVVLAGWRKWVLGSWKVPTERSEFILPRLHEVAQGFGAPCAVVRDLGRAITLAVNRFVAEQAVSIPILACHLHFLKDIGTDLLKTAHGDLRVLFRNHKIRPALGALVRSLGLRLGSHIGRARQEIKAWQQIQGHPHIPQGQAGLATVRAFTQWIIDYQAQGEGGDFPFDRPYLDFYDRCTMALDSLHGFLREQGQDLEVKKCLERLEKILTPVLSEVPFRRVVRRLKTRAGLFDELREALRLTQKRFSGREGESEVKALTPGQAAVQLNDIREQVENFSESLKERQSNKDNHSEDEQRAIEVILKHLETHGDYLWGHIVTLPDELGGGTAIVERTNNFPERFFKTMKHNERRRSGRKILAKDFEYLPPEAALVYNLNCEDYVSIVCGSLDKLDEAFAALDCENRQKKFSGHHQDFDEKILDQPMAETASLPSADRRLIRNKDMTARILEAAYGTRACS